MKITGYKRVIKMISGAYKTHVPVKHSMRPISRLDTPMIFIIIFNVVPSREAIMIEWSFLMFSGPSDDFNLVTVMFVTLRCWQF